ncbi:PH domain-containing protein [Jeotgalibacillus aurantiacus]|uniref:PH domain-containing protein n=1 Tax=Jeotgalibacillus aurantiacus TaxID=2763266 RepID=UPI001D0B6CC3|nr:PH domain-containing protein [Jeotgalibacillus aurantiacus]
MSEEKRLHPITTVINSVKAIREAIIPIIILFFVNGRGDTGSILDYVPILVTAGLIILLIFLGLIQWWRFKYWIEEGELRIEQGLLVKKKRYIPFERIQSLNYSEGIFHRPFKLVKIKVETAGSSAEMDSEAVLTAITKEEANELNRMIAAAKKKLRDKGLDPELPVVEEPDVEDRVLYKMRPKDLIVMATTSGGAGVVLGGVLIFLSQFSEVIPYEAVFNELIEFVEAGILLAGILIVLVFFIAWLIAVAMTFLRYADFTVRLVDKDLVITRGLLEKKQTTVPLKRIQGIRFDQNIIREPFRYTSVTIESAGGSVLEKDSNAIRLLPMIKENEAIPILHEVLPDYEWKVDFKGAPSRSIFRYIFWKIFFSLFVIIPVSWFFFPIGLLSLTLIPLSILLGWMQYRTAGYNLSGDQLVMRFRGISKQIVYMKKKRIQSVTWTETYFQRKGHVATITATIKSYVGGSSTSVEHLDKKDVVTLMDWYRPEAVSKPEAREIIGELET